MTAEVVGVAEHYAQFVKLCRVRIEQLGITYDTLDAICGFPARYTATLLCGGKAMSIYSFFTIARALALLPSFQHDEAQLAHLQKNGEWVKLRRPGPRFRAKRSSGVKRFQVHVDFYRQIGRKGANIMHAKRIRRKRAAQIAANARWGR